MRTSLDHLSCSTTTAFLSHISTVVAFGWRFSFISILYRLRLIARLFFLIFIRIRWSKCCGCFFFASSLKWGQTLNLYITLFMMNLFLRHFISTYKVYKSLDWDFGATSNAFLMWCALANSPVWVFFFLHGLINGACTWFALLILLAQKLDKQMFGI